MSLLSPRFTFARQTRCALPGVTMLLGVAVAASAVSNLLYAPMVGLAGWGISALQALHRGSIRRPDRAELAVFVFAAYAVLSVMWAPPAAQVNPRTVIIEYGAIPATFAMVYRLASRERGWEFLAGAYLTGALGGALLVFLSAASGTPFEESGRYSIPGVNPNYAAYSMVTALPFAVGLYGGRTRRRPRHVIAIGAVISLLGAAIALTGCRGASIAYLAALLVGFGAYVRNRPVLALTVGVVLAFAVWRLAPLVADALPTRLYSVEEQGEDVSSGRFALWERALEVFSENPVFGAGADSYPSFTDQGMHAHNVFLTALAELGLVGEAMFLGCIALIGYRIMGARSADERIGRSIGAMVLIIWVVIASTGVWLVALPPWIAFGWAVARPKCRDVQQIAPHDVGVA